MNTITKRLLHYFLLAVTLVGIPFVCCVVGGKDETLELVKTIAPVTENWGSMPEKLWNYRCPFNWGLFWLMAAFLAVTVTPFRSAAVEGRVAQGRGLCGEGAVPVVGMGRSDGHDRGLGAGVDAV